MFACLGIERLLILAGVPGGGLALTASERVTGLMILMGRQVRWVASLLAWADKPPAKGA